MALSLFRGTALGELADTRGWFTVTTPIRGGGIVRTVVYIDGDVTTKLIGARTVNPEDTAEHFATIDRAVAQVRKRLRGAVAAFIAVWGTLTLALIAARRDAASLAAAIAILTPVAVNGLQRHLRVPITLGPQITAIGAGVLVLIVSVVAGRSDLRGPAILVLVLNTALITGTLYLRSKIRTLFAVVR